MTKYGVGIRNARMARVAAALKLANDKSRLFVRAYYQDDFEGSATADEVIDLGNATDIDTGLVDHSGNPIFRVRETVKFGFVP